MIDVQTLATCPHGSEAARVRTGTPQRLYIPLVAAYPLYPTKISLFGIL